MAGKIGEVLDSKIFIFPVFNQINVPSFGKP
jgi:hypothetical protein